MSFILVTCIDIFIYVGIEQISPLISLLLFSRLDCLPVQAGVRLLPDPVNHRPDQPPDSHDVRHLLQDPGAIRYW